MSQELINGFPKRLFFTGFTRYLILGGAAFVLIPHLPLLKFILFSQVANGILLPFVLVYMLLLVNRPRLMGAFKNKPWQNVVAWGTAVTMILLTVVLVYNTISA